MTMLGLCVFDFGERICFGKKITVLLGLAALVLVGDRICFSKGISSPFSPIASGFGQRNSASA